MTGTDRKAILFDKDGTLIEYNTIWPDATRKMIPIFREKFDVKEDVSDTHLLASLGLYNQKVSDSTAIASGTTKDIARVLNQSLKDESSDVLSFVQDYFNQYTIKHQVEIKSIGNVRSLFNTLKQAGYTLGIVTADDYDSTVFTLKLLDLAVFVDFIATGDRYQAKPAAHAVESFSAAVNVPTDQILFIGDSVIDMQFARHCRKGIAVLSGVGIEAELIQYTDAIYPTIHDVPYSQYFR